MSGGYGSKGAINDGDIKLEVVADARVHTTENDQRFKRRMEKVPLLLRNEDNKGDYDPKVVSLGPYHHGKPELKFVEDLKPMVARLFVSGSGKSMEEYYTTVKSIVGDCRSCYIEGSTDMYSDDEFSEMMLLDGCFILGMIESVMGRKPGQKSKYEDVITRLGMLVWYAVRVDMVFLLENQIPFRVLESLMSIKFEDREGMIKMIDEFLDPPISSRLKFQSKKEIEAGGCGKKPLHLLQLYRIKVLLDPYDRNEVNQPLHDLESNRCIRKGKFRGKRGLNLKDYVQSFRSVTELKAKGVHFLPSNSRSLNAVEFKSFSFYGRLELRPFFVTPNTKIMMSNMIAYELCPNNPNNLEVISYVGFLKSLISHPNDVKELRSKNILLNTLGSDRGVANVYKEIATFGVEDLHIYKEVRRSVHEHYNNKGKTWMAEVIHNHFVSPWAVIAFVVATSVVILSFLQTYFTNFPRSRN